MLYVVVVGFSKGQHGIACMIGIYSAGLYDLTSGHDCHDPGLLRSVRASDRLYIDLLTISVAAAVQHTNTTTN